jgi:uncharacterized protein (TIRG00374 family)
LTLDKPNGIKFSFREIFFFSISLLFGIVILVYTFRGVALDEVLIYFNYVNIFYLILFICVVFIGAFIRAWRWKYMIESFKPDVKLGNLFSAVIIAYGVNVVLPRFGEVARAMSIGSLEGISRVSSLGTIVIERILDLIFLILTVLFGLYLFEERLESEYPWIYNSIYIGVAVFVLSLLFLVMVIKYQRIVLVWIERLFSKMSYKILDNAKLFTSKIIDGFDSVKSKKNFILIFLISPLLWVIYALGAYIGLFMLNMQEIMSVNFTHGWIIMSITTLGVLIPTPGSTGGYHAFCKSVLTMILGFAVEISLAYALLTHFLSTVPFLFVSVILFFVYQYKKRNTALT